MEVLINIKVIAIFVLLAIALVFGVLPIWFIVRSSAFQNHERKHRLQRIMACLNAFAGGVFMGISLIHLLPEVRLLLVKALGGEDKYHFNWAELCVACGFFLIVFVEQMVHICQDKLNNDNPEEEVPFASQHGTFGEVTSDAVKTTSAEEEVIQDCDADLSTLKKRRSSGTSEKSCTSASSRHAPHTIEEYAFEHGHLTPRRAMILLVSLSLHSIFEGLALGLQLDRKDLTDIFIAIALHKGIEAFTIAVGFAQIKTTLTLKLISTICFAFMSPVGIAIGIPIALFF